MALRTVAVHALRSIEVSAFRTLGNGLHPVYPEQGLFQDGIFFSVLEKSFLT